MAERPLTTSSSSAPAPAARRRRWRLAQTGKRILLIERGTICRASARTGTRSKCSAARAIRPTRPGRSADGDSFKPGLHYWVGGNSKLYGAALFRLRETDFHGVRHVDGVAPEWPLKYDVFEPYYQQAEELYRVHGARGEDPTEPWASGPYPKPPIRHEPRIAELAEGLEREGLHPFHLPMGALDRGGRGRANAAGFAAACAAIRSTAIPASPTARPTRRSSASIRR